VPTMSSHSSGADLTVVESARAELATILAREMEAPLPPGARAGADEIRARHGSSVVAIIFYGSCLRAFERGESDDDGVYDFYVLVNRYAEIYRSSAMRIANATLAPNVFSLRDPAAPSGVRAKYGVISISQFSRALSTASFDSYFWARLSQPARLAYVKDGATRGRVIEAFASAVVATVSSTLPLMGEPFQAEDVWTRAFQQTYGAELRAEPAQRARELCDWYRERYRTITPLAIMASGMALEADASSARYRVSISSAKRRRARLAWVLRRLTGKTLTALRVAKAAITFDGGLDYLLWKIARHSGKRVIPTPWQRRHPMLAGPLILWRLYRLDAYR
jgi:hypothetical protein